MVGLEDSSGVPPRNPVQQVQTSSNVKHNEKEARPGEWTDEKHSFSLKSMESTFVNQLYKSLDLFGWPSNKNCSSESKSPKHKRTGCCASSGQFKVLQDGRWSKLDFTRDEPEDNQEKKPIVPLRNQRNQWIQHYAYSERWAIGKFVESQDKAPLAAISNQYPAHKSQLLRKNRGCSKTEGTDQNFNDEEDHEEEKRGGAHEMKRTKTSTDAVITNNDQVVPFDDVAQGDDVSDSPYARRRLASCFSRGYRG